MLHFIVSCEFRGERRNTVEVPVSVARKSVDGVEVTRMLAAEAGERMAYESFGGTLTEWFAWKVAIDNE
jgi:hypothetical protein